MEFLQQVAARLYEIRKEMRLNQQQMGEIMGVSRASYSLYENGKLPIDVVMLDRLREKTGYDADYLLGYSDIKHINQPPVEVKLVRGNPPSEPPKGYKRMVIADDDEIEFKKILLSAIDEELKKRGL